MTFYRKLAVLGLLTLSQLAYGADSSSGCGLGWMVMSKNSLVSSFARALTNATFSSTIGMTLGTSGCAQHSIVKNNKLPLHYTEANYQQLMVEMALGQGEYLYTYSQVLGCDQTVYADFAQTLKTNYSNIFEGQKNTPQKVLKNVSSKIKLHPTLSQHCKMAII